MERATKSHCIELTRLKEGTNEGRRKKWMSTFFETQLTKLEQKSKLVEREKNDADDAVELCLMIDRRVHTQLATNLH